ncbi:hypothetical protein DAPPUDRAFT_117748 [Daphnia pulex]|uniref:Uncharacterized protein n=1 Tax=Daphnia pulex TaxID=6669 RepID=E9HTN8_DAPPU|nr:hypothetical protein DAPPUDRAFT_117748 [Daphnia pulex]|eukprot:EFX64881.1 hypothetical protein DAPPUDRAFT_117748 [Daphnia pulex]
MSKSAKTSLPLVTTMMPCLSRPNFQKGVDVFPTTGATPAGSPTDPATTTLFDPVTEILSTLLNRDRVAMEPADFASDPEQPGHLPQLQSSVPSEPVSFIEFSRSARLRAQRDSNETHPALFCQDGHSRQQQAFLSISAALAIG